MHREVEKIRKAGAELVLVGFGDLRWAKAFQEEFHFSCPIFVDSSRAAYKALGMRRGIARTFSLSSVWAGRRRAARGGFRQKGVKGDPWQLGGVLVVARGGRVAYEHFSETASDHPPLEDVLAALEKAVA